MDKDGEDGDFLAGNGKELHDPEGDELVQRFDALDGDAQALVIEMIAGAPDSRPTFAGAVLWQENLAKARELRAKNGNDAHVQG